MVTTERIDKREERESNTSDRRSADINIHLEYTKKRLSASCVRESKLQHPYDELQRMYNKSKENLPALNKAVPVPEVSKERK